MWNWWQACSGLCFLCGLMLEKEVLDVTPRFSDELLNVSKAGCSVWQWQYCLCGGPLLWELCCWILRIRFSSCLLLPLLEPLGKWNVYDAKWFFNSKSVIIFQNSTWKSSDLTIFSNLNRTLQTPTQVPVVVSPGNQQLHTVTLQTVPLTTVIASTDPASATTPQKFILQAIPTSQPMTVLKENVMLQSQKPVSPPSSIVLSPAQVQQVLTSSVQTVCNGTANMASSPSFSATTPVVTFSPSSSQVVAHPSGTVITSVIKAPETKQVGVQGAVKEDDGDKLDETEQLEQRFQQQPFVMVVSSSNGFPSNVQVKQEDEPLEPNSY